MMRRFSGWLLWAVVIGAVVGLGQPPEVQAEQRPFRPNEEMPTPILGTPTPEPPRQMTQEDIIRMRDAYVERFKLLWEQPEQLLELYADEAMIVRNNVRNNKEVGRNVYTSGQEIYNAVKRRPNIKKGQVDVKVYDIRGFVDEDEGYLVFRQDFTSRTPQGKIAYQDSIIKTVRQVLNEDGEWKVVYENSQVYDPDNYMNDLNSIVADFLKEVQAGPEVVLKPIVDSTPTPIPTETPIPTPTPLPAGKFFRVVHEVTYEGIPDARMDIVDLQGNTVDTKFTNEDGFVVFRENETPETFLGNFLYFNRYGHDERELFRNTWDESKAFEVVILPLEKPLRIPQVHETVAGENLQELSTYYYSTPDFWRELLHLNNDLIIRDYDLPEGVVLQLPTVEQLRELRKSQYSLIYQAKPDHNVDRVARKFFNDYQTALSAWKSSVQYVPTLALTKNVDVPEGVPTDDLYEIVVSPVEVDDLEQ